MAVQRSSVQRDRFRSVIARGHPPCWICGLPIDYEARYPDPRSFVVDHRVALGRGGPDTLANCAAAHAGCNRLKSDREHAPVIRRSGALNRP